MTNTLKITTARGIPFNVVAHQDDKGHWLVDFYDDRFHGPHFHPEFGQFVSSYYADTLTNGDDARYGLCLCGHESDWTLDAASFARVRAFLNAPAEGPVIERQGSSPLGAFNVALHQHLTRLGYRHRRVDAQFEDRGNGESGPMISTFPAYDEYKSFDEYVFATAEGRIEVEPRDQHFEAWVDQQLGAA
ncbi:hypothetical protein [Hyphomicrobium sp.]|uniref:hypothetical protein n=1 Tax=Hyphomicrobium sp. TaxID=82 RepID=UPI001DA49CA2|nr:hypothetical protein [Hyphomicrobium sp.]MBY0561504.1 hypothetical protein [Hyphomicrobium sp.]